MQRRGTPFAARMERSEIPDFGAQRQLRKNPAIGVGGPVPDCALLHPGYSAKYFFGT
jgi:hypothetical protein